MCSPIFSITVSSFVTPAFFREGTLYRMWKLKEEMSTSTATTTRPSCIVSSS